MGSHFQITRFQCSTTRKKFSVQFLELVLLSSRAMQCGASTRMIIYLSHFGEQKGTIKMCTVLRDPQILRAKILSDLALLLSMSQFSF